MTLYFFKLLSPEVQLRYVLERGTFLAQRWEDEGGINLYHLPDARRGFFVEISYDASQHGAMVLRSFHSSVPLDAYAHWVLLPEW
jgi:hypothetical protein